MTAPPTKFQRLSLVGGAFLAAAAVASCSIDKTLKTTPLKFVIHSDPLVNQNTRGEPSPVVVRIYELKSTTNFDRAQFFELFDNDAKRLGPDLVAKRETELKPGEKYDLERNTPIETRYIGVIAGFRLGNEAQWRSTTEIKPDRDNTILVKLTAHAISVEASQSWWKIF
ncbi:type VI secretion system lipoprotein TssJ [Bradyrhizobium sp. UFLA05-153]